jgi:hypothetical protein
MAGEESVLGSNKPDPGLLNICMSALGWDRPPPESKDVGGTWILNGTMLSDLKRGPGVII